MIEIIAIVALILLLYIIFNPRQGTGRRRKRKLSDKPYWLDKRGY